MLLTLRMEDIISPAYSTFICAIVRRCVLHFIFCCMVGLTISAASAKDVIRFPDQELAADYVFPVFDKTRAVLNRNVTLKNRVEIKLSTGLRIDEPIYHFFSFLGSLSFYWSESAGIGLSGIFFMPGLSNQGEKLRSEGVEQTYRRNQDGTLKSVRDIGFYFDAGLAPVPLFASFLDFQFNPLYGKISITKKLVFNFALYSFAGLGGIAYQFGEDHPLMLDPAAHFGFGQRLYFGRYISLEGGIDFLIYQGPNPILPSLKHTPEEDKPERPAYTAFEKDLFFRLQARVGIVFIL